MKKAYVMVGLPGLGKSYFVNKFKDKETFVYSTDDALEAKAKELEKTYSEVFDDYIKEVSKDMDFLLGKAIVENKNLIFDQTNLGRKKRLRVINRVLSEGYYVVGNVILPPENASTEDNEVWQNRLDERAKEGKIIPDSLLENMKSSFVIPSMDEGYNELYFYDMYNNQLKGN